MQGFPDESARSPVAALILVARNSRKLARLRSPGPGSIGRDERDSPPRSPAFPPLPARRCRNLRSTPPSTSAVQPANQHLCQEMTGGIVTPILELPPESSGG